MTVHGFEQLFTRRRGRQVEPGIQSVELEYVVMKRPGSRRGTEIGGWLAAARSQPRTIARPVGQVPRSQALGQPLRGSGNIKERPVQRVQSVPVGSKV